MSKKPRTQTGILRIGAASPEAAPYIGYIEMLIAIPVRGYLRLNR